MRFRNDSGGLRGSETPLGGLRTMPCDPRNTACQIPGRGTPISTLSAKRCVFATIQEASGGQKRPPEALEPCHAIPEALPVRFPGPCGGVRGTPISTLSARRCVFATFREASGGQIRPREALDPCHEMSEALLCRFPGPCGGVRGTGPGTPISTLSAKRCVFATFREASGGQKRPSEALELC